MRKYIFCSFVAVAVLAVAGAWFARSAIAEKNLAAAEVFHDEQIAPDHKADETTLSEFDEDKLQAIMEIRQRLHINLLEGSCLDERAVESTSELTSETAPPDFDFSQLLTNAIRANGPDEIGRLTSDSRQSDYARRTRDDQPVANEFGATLRAASRQLRQRASELEQSRQFDRANELRRLARKVLRAAGDEE